MSEPKTPRDANAAYSRLIQFADKVFLAAEDLDQLGGVKAVAGGWSSSRVAKTVATLRSARAALDEQIKGLEAVGRRRRMSRPGGPGKSTDPAE